MRAITRIQFAFVRKQPQQARSRRMVERILATSRELLRAEGYEAFTTNRVAREAVVSPGSLYQYFPDRAALLDEVIDRWSADVSERVAAALADRVAERDADVLHRVVDAVVTALEGDRELLRIVLVELPPARTRPSLLALERRVRELGTAFLAGRAPLPPATAATRAWVLALAVEHLTVRWVLDEPGIDRATLVEEVTRLCDRYAGPPTPYAVPDGGGPG